MTTCGVVGGGWWSRDWGRPEQRLLTGRGRWYTPEQVPEEAGFETRWLLPAGIKAEGTTLNQLRRALSGVRISWLPWEEHEETKRTLN